MADLGSAAQNGMEQHVTIVDKSTGGETKFRCYDYKTLIKTDNLPSGVDPARKEVHLVDSEFQDVFKMSRDAFDDLPQWRQVALKKKVGLF